MWPVLRVVSLLFLSSWFTCTTSVAEAPSTLPTATLAIGGSVPANTTGGTYQVDFNGYVELINYGQLSTPASLASGLAAMFTRDYVAFGLYARAGANSGTDPSVITFQLVNGSTFGQLNVTGPSTPFTFAPTGFGSTSSGVPDIGTVALQFNGATIATATYGDGSTAASIAEKLAQTANSSLVTVTSEGQNLYLQSTQTGTYSSPYSLVFTSTQSGFSQSSFSSTPASGQLTGTSETAAATVYSYVIQNGAQSGYDHAGNVLNLSDSVMGNWGFNYDYLDRLVGGQASTGNYAGQFACWSYDDFGNRTSQSISTVACTGTPKATFSAVFAASNRVSSVTTPTGISFAYDNAGNIQNDGRNSYYYDAEGRICAVSGPDGLIGYQYDADGNRVGKGTITNPNICDVSQNGYKQTTDYVLDQANGQMTEVSFGSGTPTWQHTDVNANGTLIATYDGQGLHFYLNDPVGSRRVQTDPAGFPEQTCQSLPFGDQLYCTGSLTSPTEHHFTGKERDGESGNDYFEARYYSSAMGRFMSPDWSAKEEPVPYATMDDPQSLNLYSYVRNNPLSRTDPDGHCDSNGQNCSAWDHFAGAVGGALNIIPATLNLPNQAFNAISGAFNGPQIDLIPMIQADAHASQTGIDVGTAAATAVPLAAAAAEVKTAGMVVGEVNTVSKVDSIANQIDEGGFKVTQNPKTPGQDANVTITHPSEPGVNLNLRSETHPLPGSGSKPVPHVNVEKVTPRTGTSPKKIDNTHITQ
jgi:RHS repeat-associated protein